MNATSIIRSKLDGCFVHQTAGALVSRFGWLISPRMFWSAVLAGHLLAIPSLIEHFGSAERIGDYGAPVLRAIILAASAAFFVAKIRDVPWLRLRPGWRSTVSAALVIAFLHAGIVQHAQPASDDSTPTRLVASLFLTATVPPAGLRKIQHFLRVLTQLLRRRLTGYLALWRRLCCFRQGEPVPQLTPPQSQGIAASSPRSPPV